MDRNYKIKLENWLTAKTVNEQLLISCLAAFDARASRLAVKQEKYRHSSDYMCQSAFEEANTQLHELVEYRKPFLAVLCNEYRLTIDAVKTKMDATLSDPRRSKNIPTKREIDEVRELLMSGFYSVVL